MQLSTPVFELGDALELPEIAALKNDRVRIFVWNYAHNGQNARQAALEAGFSKSWSDRWACGLVHRDDICEALVALSKKMVKEGAFVGLQVALQVARDPTHKNQLKAAFGLMDRGGLGPSQNIAVTHKHEPSEDEWIARVTAFAKAIGADPVALLGSNTPQIEAKKVADDEYDF